nr:hypothetical protein 4 [bacterium]
MSHLESFSSGYYIAGDVEILPYSGRNAAIPHDLHDDLEAVVGFPVYGSIAGIRHRLRPESGIPANTVALPKHDYSACDEVLLIEKPWAGGQFRNE